MWHAPTCRGDHTALLKALLSCFSNHTTAQLFEKFEALADYLNLPRPLHKLLPPVDLISLRHLSVLDLYYYAMAKQAVDVMLDSTAYTRSSLDSDAAYFFISSKQQAGLNPGRVDDISVYALGGPALLPGVIPPANLGLGPDQPRVTYCRLQSSGSDGMTAILLGGPTEAAAVPFPDAVGTDSANRSGSRGVSKHTCLGRHMAALLKCSLPSYAQFSSGIFRFNWPGMERGSYCLIQLWAIYW